MPNDKMVFRNNQDWDLGNGQFQITGNIGMTKPTTAALHLKAGTAAANTSPLKMVTGPLLTTPEPGALEYLDPFFYFTASDGVRRCITAFNCATTEIPYVMLPMDSYFSTSGASVGGANAIRIVKFFLSRKMQVGWYTFNLAAGTSNLISMGIYSRDAQTLLSYTGVLTGAAGLISTAATASVVLHPGYYWYAWTSNGTGTTWHSVAGSAGFDAINNNVGVLNGLASDSSVNGALPASLSGVSASTLSVAVLKLTYA